MRAACASLHCGPSSCFWNFFFCVVITELCWSDCEVSEFVCAVVRPGRVLFSARICVVGDCEAAYTRV